MKKDFTPHSLSLRMKQLGFDEDCMAYYTSEGTFLLTGHLSGSTIPNFINNTTSAFILTFQESASAPSLSQAFRWFRERYELDCSFEDELVEDDKELVEDDNEIQMWDFFIYKTKQKSDNKVMSFCSNNFDTYIESYTREEAEIACLDKLIEIVESKS